MTLLSTCAKTRKVCLNEWQILICYEQTNWSEIWAYCFFFFKFSLENWAKTNEKNCKVCGDGGTGVTGSGRGLLLGWGYVHVCFYVCTMVCVKRVGEWYWWMGASSCEISVFGCFLMPFVFLLECTQIVEGTTGIWRGYFCLSSLVILGVF